MIDLSQIPDALKDGESFQLLTIDPEWIWLARDGDEVVGLLLAANCHGLALLWRLKMLPTASPMALRRLLRQFIRDIRSRNMLGYFVMLDIMDKPCEQALARVAYRAGAKFVPFTGVVAVGSTEMRHA